VMMTLGTGVGGAAMVGGRLLRGRHFQAGVLGGHLLADVLGRRCTCGARGCVEAEASTWALPQLAREQPGFERSRLAAAEQLDFEALFACAEAGDAVALALRERCLRVWGAGAVSMIHAWDPELLVVGGGVMAAAGTVLPAIEAYVHAHAWTPWGKVNVRQASLGSDAALLGAVPLLAGA
ncbi:MAG TPA: ROK family protein, partial [Vicinamibacteria bacterium]|nr:ROK family protein [Vicinamibacteria bacterium]